MYEQSTENLKPTDTVHQKLRRSITDEKSTLTVIQPHSTKRDHESDTTGVLGAFDLEAAKLLDFSVSNSTRRKLRTII